MPTLTREQILQGGSLKSETVTIPELGGDVVVRELTGGERDRFESLLFEGQRRGESVNVRATLVALSTVDEDGNRIFTDRDIPKLADKSARMLSKIFAIAQRLSGIGVVELEEKAGNSEAPIANGSDSLSGAESPSDGRLVN